MSTPRHATPARLSVLRRRRQVAAAGLLLCCTLLVVAGFKLAAALTNSPDATASASSPAQVTTPKTPATTGSTGSKSSSPQSTSPQSSSRPPAVAARPTPARATGEYARAPGGTARLGSGALVTYAVEAETGTGQSAPTFAAVVDATLADPSSWAGQGRWSVQRVAGDDVDLVIRLATPATVDKACAAAGLRTNGYASCRVGQFVMINLDRWLRAVPDYRGNVALYRQYVINHEVGHGLGLGHQACPGPGRPAPVMQQQTFGLDGCLPNGSPYVAGVLVSGPATA